jgi:hypothetical protein
LRRTRRTPTDRWDVFWGCAPHGKRRAMDDEPVAVIHELGCQWLRSRQFLHCAVSRAGREKWIYVLSVHFAEHLVRSQLRAIYFLAIVTAIKVLGVA